MEIDNTQKDVWTRTAIANGSKIPYSQLMNQNQLVFSDQRQLLKSIDVELVIEQCPFVVLVLLPQSRCNNCQFRRRCNQYRGHLSRGNR